MPRPKPLQKNLLIAFDAFGTLFSPRAPIGAQYGEIARKHGICKDVSDEEIMDSFKKAFKRTAKAKPNYGKAAGMDPTAWWTEIINQTFTPFASLPPQLPPHLLTHFASNAAYTLDPGAAPLLASIRRARTRGADRNIVTAVITNSDDRVAGILRSFGLRVGGGGEADASKGSEAKPPDVNDIDFVLTSYECGIEKPGAGIFEAAVEVARERFGGGGGGEWERVYVGDEVGKDVVGAEGAGWEGVVLVVREGEEKKGEGDGGVGRVVRSSEVGGEGEGDVRVVGDLRELEAWFVDGGGLDG